MWSSSSYRFLTDSASASFLFPDALFTYRQLRIASATWRFSRATDLLSQLTPFSSIVSSSSFRSPRSSYFSHPSSSCCRLSRPHHIPLCNLHVRSCSPSPPLCVSTVPPHQTDIRPSFFLAPLSSDIFCSPSSPSYSFSTSLSSSGSASFCSTTVSSSLPPSSLTSSSSSNVFSNVFSSPSPIRLASTTFYSYAKSTATTTTTSVGGSSANNNTPTYASTTPSISSSTSNISVSKRSPSSASLPPPLSLTDAAARRIAFLLSRRQADVLPDVEVAVKVGLRREGCNGLSYVMDYTTVPTRIMEETKGASNSGGSSGTTTTGISRSGNNRGTSRMLPGGDLSVRDKGVLVVLDRQAVMYLVGTVMDFTEDALSSKFVFSNPNKRSECGCGKSFTV
eukprot:GHVS01003791.1.p1 GENE.GHVS01003791.1~~GHVS01003791.1.p1  ORF type:complete len:394 (+),score=97.82 GHVS01003791.1:77-1258(+)